MLAGAKVYGLRELRAELKKLDNAADLQDELKDANFKAADFVVEHAKRKAGTVSRQAAAAAESLRASRAAARAQVLIGSAAVPFALGAEFGSHVYKQFPTWRGNSIGAGYFLWPTIRERMDEVVEYYGEELDKITRKAFPD